MKLQLLIGFFLVLTQAASAECLMSIASTTPAPPLREAALKRHASLVEALDRASPRFVVIGDSIAQQWPQDQIAAMAGGKPSFNLGVGGDRTEHVLWRLAQIKADLSKVETYVLAIGTNNLTARYPACSINAGIDAITAALKKRSPSAQIIVLNVPAIFRDGDRFDIERTAVNAALNHGKVKTVATSGNLPCTETECLNYKADRVHLSPQAYAVIGREISAAERK